MGAGAFKTAHTVRLVLLVPTMSGIGSHAHKTIIIKHPYTCHPGQFNEGPFKHLGVREESEKLFHKANVLYWMKALFKPGGTGRILHKMMIVIMAPYYRKCDSEK